VTLVLLSAHAFLDCTIWPLGRAKLLASSEGLTATVTALGPVAQLPTNIAPLVVGAVAAAAGLRVGLLVLLIAPPVMLLLMRGRGPKT
jgi:hypothetical protein